MAKYKAAPFYGIAVGNKKITFDYFGEYETESTSEIKALDALAPKWITKIDEPIAESPQEKKEPEAAKSAEQVKKPSTQRKSSAK